MKKQNKIKRLVISILLGVIFVVFVPQVFAQLATQSNVVITKVGNAKDTDRPGGTANFKFYCQADPQWNQNSCGIDVAGCGPTSMAMIVSSFGVIMTPVQMDQLFQQSGARKCGDDGSSLYAFIQSGWLKNNGFQIQPVALNSDNTLNLQNAKVFLDNGYLIIGGSGDFPCPTGGWCKNPGAGLNHIFDVDKVNTANNTISVRDPINCRPESGSVENPTQVNKPNTFHWFYAYAIKKAL